MTVDLKQHLPALQVVVPLIGAMLCGFLRSGTLAWFWASVVSWISAAISILLTLRVIAEGTISYHLGGWAPPIGIEYRVDLLAAFILTIVALSGAVIMIFARKSVTDEIDGDKQAWFYTLYLLCFAGLLGIAITGDAFNAFVFLEISSLATYTLIALGRNRRALLAAYQYLIVGTIGATFYIIGVGLLYVVTGTLNIVDLSQRIGSAEYARPILAALAFITVGISLKLALFPLHAWLPNAYAYAPSVTTAFLAGTATKVAIYLLLRYFFTVYGASAVFTSLPTSEILLALSVAAIFGASLVAVYQTDLKRMLAYSSVAQIGYITLGIALANQSGLTGALAHIFNHALIKTTLFLVAGAVIYATGARTLDDLAGMGRRMPLLMICLVVAALGLVGVPGTAGFISKFLLAEGAIAKGWSWLVFLIVVSSFIAVLYVGRFVEAAWLRAPRDDDTAPIEIPLSMTAPIVALTVAIVWFGFDTRITSGLTGAIAKMLLGGAP